MEALFEFEGKKRVFRDPIRIIRCHRLSNIKKCLEEIELETKAGRYAAGFLSYEAGCAFEDKLAEEQEYDFPLLCFGIYGAYTGAVPKGGLEDNISGASVNEDEPQYHKKIEKIRSYIKAGDVYQITYCIKFRFRHEGNKYDLYRKMLDYQKVPYPAFIRTQEYSIVSLSPELFLKRRGNNIKTKPMKGTWWRGRGPIDDMLNKFRLGHDPKNRAENVMITDLLRNDLGKIGAKIRVPRLFEVDRYRTLFQMTSTVTAEAGPDLSLTDIIRALFPSGSVTGAPKIRAMQIINELENEERRIYTGAIGYIEPSGDTVFNVPIRTLLFRGDEGEMGVGGGIVWDSTPEGEYRECMIKAGFVIGRR